MSVEFGNNSGVDSSKDIKNQSLKDIFADYKLELGNSKGKKLQEKQSIDNDEAREQQEGEKQAVVQECISRRGTETCIQNNREQVKDILEYDKKSLSYFKEQFKSYDGIIDGPKTLRRACRVLSLNIRSLQKAIGTKVDGNLGPKTYRAYERKIINENINLTENSKTLAEYQNLFSEYKGKIRSSRDLRRVCRNLGIDVEDLQRNIGTKDDGIIGKNTLKKFKNKVMGEGFYGSIDDKGNLTQNKEERKRSGERIREIDGLKNREYIEALNLPKSFQIIGNKFLNNLKSREVLKPKDPLALVNGNTKEMVYIINGKWQKFPVLLGKGGLSKGYASGDRKTITGEIHRFNPSISRLASSPNGDASNSGNSKTVKSASLQSNLSARTGGRYFHGVADYRIKGRNSGMGTWGCVGVDVNTIRKMYADVRKNGKGYGYVDVA